MEMVLSPRNLSHLLIYLNRKHMNRKHTHTQTRVFTEKCILGTAYNLLYFNFQILIFLHIYSEIKSKTLTVHRILK